MKIWKNDASDPQFCNRKSQLTSYALNCGYREQVEISNEHWVTLSGEDKHYRVTRINWNASPAKVTATFHKLTDARKAFATHCAER